MRVLPGFAFLKFFSATCRLGDDINALCILFKKISIGILIQVDFGNFKIHKIHILVLCCVLADSAFRPPWNGKMSISFRAE